MSHANAMKFHPDNLPPAPDSLHSQLAIARRDNAELLEVLAECRMKVISAQLRAHEHTERTQEDGDYARCLDVLVARVDNLLAAHQVGSRRLVRYCFECGHVGEVGPNHVSCCPDGRSDYVRPEIAEQAKAGFQRLYLERDK